MPDHAPPGPVRRPGLLGWIALLPGVLVGFCLGTWMLAIALEWLVENLAIVSGALQQGLAALIASLNGQSGLFWTETVTTVIRCALLSGGNVTLTFLLRLAILLQALPLFALIIFVGLIDGLVRRDLRRFGAGHDSGFVYHYGRGMIFSCLLVTFLVWLTAPIILKPIYTLIPGVILTASIASVTIGAFKKYL